MGKTVILIATIFLAGCAGLTIGKYPYPKGVDVAPEKRSMAKMETADFQILQQVEGYTPDFALIGVVVPVIPFGQWKWLTGIGKDDLRISLYLWLTPKSQAAQFEPGPLKIAANGVTHFPSEIRVGRHCGIKENTVPVDTSKPLLVHEKACVWYIFDNLRPPDSSFSVIAKGLPTTEYMLKRKIRFGYLSQ